MGNYQDDQEWMMRDLKHQENLALLADYFHVYPNQVIEFLRPKFGSITEMIDVETNETVSSNFAFSDAPRGATEIELAEWAVRRVAELKSKAAS